MSASVVPFPLVRRRALIEKQARYAASINADAAERHIQNQIALQGDTMRRRGIDEELIVREMQCMEAAIRAALCKASIGQGGRN